MAGWEAAEAVGWPVGAQAPAGFTRKMKDSKRMKTAADTVDFGDLGLCRETEHEVKAVLAQWKEQEMRLELAKVRESVNGEGHRRTFRDEEGNGGEVTMRIPPSYYHLYGNHYGYECWDDDDFCRQVLKHYPEMRVVSKSQNPTIIVPNGFAGTPLERNCRFTKTYTENKAETKI